jgi:Fe2+ or Zn2+ uptake regulation protein
MQTHPHDHVQCTRRGRIFDIEPDCLKEIDRKIEQGTIFPLKDTASLFRGFAPVANRENINKP